MKSVSKLLLVVGFCTSLMLFVSNSASAAESSGDAEIIQAQNAPPATNRISPNARNAARDWLANSTFKRGWDADKNRIVIIGNAGANIESDDDSFIDIRNSLYVEAELQAKATIISTFVTTASAENIVSIPGNPIAAQVELEQKQLKDLLKREKKAASAARKEAAEILQSVDKARAEELEGVSFGDRLNRLLDAAIKKIDESYAEGGLADEKQKRVEELKTRWQEAQGLAQQASAKEDAIEAKIKELQGSVIKETRSVMEEIAEMPLFGAITLQQFESYDDVKELFQLSIVMAWSPKLEQEARSMLLTQGSNRKPRPNKMSLQERIRTWDLSTMVGTRRYLAADGTTNFMGISAVAFDPDDAGMYSFAEMEAELWAKQLAILSMTGDMESHKRAEQLKRQTRAEGGKTKEEVLKDFSAEMRNSVQGAQIRGLEISATRDVIHPASGQDIVVAVATVNSDIAAKAGDLMADTFATLKEFNEDQSFKAGQVEGMVSAAEASKNDPAARAAGFSDGSGAVNQEFIGRNAAANRNSAGGSQRSAAGSRAPAPAGRSAQTQSGTWGGDDEVDDDF